MDLTKSSRSRPLPAIPPLQCLTQLTLIQDRPAPHDPDPQNTSPQLRSNRDSVLTFTSSHTNLPRYSTIDFANLDLSFQQFDLWNEPSEPPPFVEGFNSISVTISTPKENGSPESSKSQPAPTKQSPNLVIHRFYIGGRSGGLGLGKSKADPQKPWASLKVISRAPFSRSKKGYPMFIAGDVLRGCVNLQLDKPMNVHSIKVILKAHVQARAWDPHQYEEYRTILENSYVVYSKKTSSDPRWKGQCKISRNKENNGTLHGAYSFPFSLPIPNSVEWRNSSRNTATIPVLSFDAPPSFREQSLSSAVTYELSLVVTHGALKSKSRVASEIIYLPKRVSAPASPKRQAAYREGALLPGPLTDPGGWHALESVVVQGQHRFCDVEFSCTLYIAKPLSYTRGTVIPCYAVFSCVNVPFLDATVTPRTINLHLFRYIRHSTHWARSSKGKSLEGNTTTTHIAKAVWWNPAKTDRPLDSTERHLEGEVHLPKNMSPTCEYPLFNIEYVLEVLSFNLPSFASNREIPGTPKSGANDEDEPLATCKVDIATFHGQGPIPRAFTTPVVEDHPIEKGKRKSENIHLMSPYL